jgi:hypothetical protein
MYPLAVIPFSYITSFVFSDDTTAQICTLFIHFLMSGAFTAVVYVLQLIPITAAVGDVLRFVGLIVPSFCVVHAFIFTKDSSLLSKSREQAISTYPDLKPWPEEPWAWDNLKADLVAMIAHFVVGLLVLGIIESPLFDSCKDCACCDKAMARDDDDLDEDVLAEEERLHKLAEARRQRQEQGEEIDEEAQLKLTSSMRGEGDVIQVNNFQKTYTRSCQ